MFIGNFTICEKIKHHSQYNPIFALYDKIKNILGIKSRMKQIIKTMVLNEIHIRGLHQISGNRCREFIDILNFGLIIIGENTDLIVNTANRDIRTICNNFHESLEQLVILSHTDDIICVNSNKIQYFTAKNKPSKYSLLLDIISGEIGNL